MHGDGHSSDGASRQNTGLYGKLSAMNQADLKFALFAGALASVLLAVLVMTGEFDL